MKNLKAGFTLVELMVFFMFISLILAASTPIITKRVKNIPEKVSHGTYICYKNGANQLRQAYYNSTRQIIDEQVGTCTFNPPRKAALYKIEIIGAGAGGTRYKRHIDYSGNIGTNWKEEMNIHYATYDVKTQTPTGRYYKDVSGSILKQLLNNRIFEIEAVVPAGGSGGSITAEYTPISDPSLTVTNNALNCIKLMQENIGTSCGAWDFEAPEYVRQFYEAVDKIKETVVNDYRYCDHGEDELCYGRFDADYYRDIFAPIFRGIVSEYPALLDPPRRKTPVFEVTSMGTEAEATGNGQRGGQGGILQMKAKFLFKTPTVPSYSVDQSEQYLKDLFGSIQKGTWTAAQGFALGSNSQGSSGENINHKSGETTMHAENGGDVQKFTAIKFFNSIITNEKNAKGGEGGHISLPDGQLIVSNYSENNRADKAEGFTFKGGNSSDYRNYGGISPNGISMTNMDSPDASDNVPTITLETNLNKRTHTVGRGGGAGEVKTFYAPALADDCTFNVADGGAPHELSVFSGRNPLDPNSIVQDTTLSCNEGKLNFLAKGGAYGITTYSESYDFDYCLDGDGICRPSAPSLDTVSKGKSSEYTPTNVFTNLNVQALANVGSGGDSEKIVDGCVYPSGYYKYKLNTTLEENLPVHSITRNYVFDHPECEVQRQVHIENPTGGRGGAIIISW